MGVYSNTDITQALASGHIVCHPFNPKHVAHASLDVTLGYYYYRIEKMQERTIYNPFDREDVERFFTGTELVAPGVVAVPEWRPDPDTPSVHRHPVLRLAVAGVARKP